MSGAGGAGFGTTRSAAPVLPVAGTSPLHASGAFSSSSLRDHPSDVAVSVGSTEEAEPLLSPASPTQFAIHAQRGITTSREAAASGALMLHGIGTCEDWPLVFESLAVCDVTQQLLRRGEPMSGYDVQTDFRLLNTLAPDSLKGATLVWSNPRLHLSSADPTMATNFFTVFENADSHTMWIGIGGDHSISELNTIVEKVLLAHPPPELESWSQHVISLLAGTVPTAEICERLAAGWTVTFTGFSLGGAIAAHLTSSILESRVGGQASRGALRCLSFGSSLAVPFRDAAVHMSRSVNHGVFHNFLLPSDPVPALLHHARSDLSDLVNRVRRAADDSDVMFVNASAGAHPKVRHERSGLPPWSPAAKQTKSDEAPPDDDVRDLDNTLVVEEHRIEPWPGAARGSTIVRFHIKSSEAEKRWQLPNAALLKNDTFKAYVERNDLSATVLATTKLLAAALSATRKFFRYHCPMGHFYFVGDEGRAVTVVPFTHSLAVESRQHLRGDELLEAHLRTMFSLMGRDVKLEEISTHSLLKYAQMIAEMHRMLSPDAGVALSQAEISFVTGRSLVPLPEPPYCSAPPSFTDNTVEQRLAQLLSLRELRPGQTSTEPVAMRVTLCAPYLEGCMRGLKSTLPSPQSLRAMYTPTALRRLGEGRLNVATAPSAAPSTSTNAFDAEGKVDGAGLPARVIRRGGAVLLNADGEEDAPALRDRNSSLEFVLGMTVSCDAAGHLLAVGRVSLPSIFGPHIGHAADVEITCRPQFRTPTLTERVSLASPMDLLYIAASGWLFSHAALQRPSEPMQAAVALQQLSNCLPVEMRGPDSKPIPPLRSFGTHLWGILRQYKIAASSLGVSTVSVASVSLGAGILFPPLLVAGAGVAAVAASTALVAGGMALGSAEKRRKLELKLHDVLTALLSSVRTDELIARFVTGRLRLETVVIEEALAGLLSSKDQAALPLMVSEAQGLCARDAGAAAAADSDPWDGSPLTRASFLARIEAEVALCDSAPKDIIARPMQVVLRVAHAHPAQVEHAATLPSPAAEHRATCAPLPLPLPQEVPAVGAQPLQPVPAQALDTQGAAATAPVQARRAPFEVMPPEFSLATASIEEEERRITALLTPATNTGEYAFKGRLRPVLRNQADTLKLVHGLRDRHNRVAEQLHRLQQQVVLDDQDDNARRVDQEARTALGALAVRIGELRSDLCESTLSTCLFIYVRLYRAACRILESPAVRKSLEMSRASRSRMLGGDHAMRSPRVLSHAPAPPPADISSAASITMWYVNLLEAVYSSLCAAERSDDFPNVSDMEARLNAWYGVYIRRKFENGRAGHLCVYDESDLGELVQLLDDRNRPGNPQGTRPVSAAFPKDAALQRDIVTTLYYISKMHEIRSITQRHCVITVAGQEKTGKSTIMEEVFGIPGLGHDINFFVNTKFPTLALAATMPVGARAPLYVLDTPAYDDSQVLHRTFMQPYFTTSAGIVLVARLHHVKSANFLDFLSATAQRARCPVLVIINRIDEDFPAGANNAAALVAREPQAAEQDARSRALVTLRGSADLLVASIEYAVGLVKEKFRQSNFLLDYKVRLSCLLAGEPSIRVLLEQLSRAVRVKQAGPLSDLSDGLTHSAVWTSEDIRRWAHVVHEEWQAYAVPARRP